MSSDHAPITNIALPSIEKGGEKEDPERLAPIMRHLAAAIAAVTVAVAEPSADPRTPQLF